MTDKNRVLLPSKVIPSNYKITLIPDLTNFTFKGHVLISAISKNQISEVVLNAAELEIEKATLTISDESPYNSNISLDPDNETLTITLNEPVAANTILDIDIEFNGILNDRLLGFYRSKYVDPKGNEKYLATTQFEATDARRAFPCWDEPERKATFDVTLIVPNELTALSNMDVKSETQLDNNTKEVTFNTTPVMSTYLLAFVVGDLACIERKSQHGTQMRIWATKGKESQGEYALDTSIKLLDFYNEYFGIPFPLPKLDHIAIPDFAAGAMENWGAITYREVALLVDPKNTSASTKQTVAAIISHEMAHMWFGDLVTMKWWNDLWLNESFASWMGDKAVDAVFPEWEMWTQFLTSDTASAFSLDGLSNSHPIEQEVKNPAEIGQLFDAISYSKGGSTLRMLEAYIGAKDFQTGITEYLNTHAYNNAETSDLWDALGKSSGKPVAQVMNSWVKQTGFPVLSVEKSDNEIILSQKRFLYENINYKDDFDDQSKWYIPINIQTSNKGIISELMDTNIKSIPLNSSDNSWVKINPDQTGFYRVKYDSQSIEQFHNLILSKTLPPRDRLGLQGDAYAIARAGYDSPVTFLSLATSYIEEDDASVVSDLASGLRGIEHLIDNSNFHNAYQGFCVSIFKNIGDKIGWNKKSNETHLDTLLRNIALSNLGHYEHPETIKEALQRFERYQEDTANVHPDIRSIVFNISAKNGTRDTYDIMWELEQSSSLQEEKVRLHGALSSFKNPDLLQETLQHSLGERIRTQDTIRLIVSVASSNVGRPLAWNFVKENWSEIDRRYGDGGFGLMRLVSLVSGFKTQQELEDVEQFFTDNPTPAAGRTIKQALERIRLNLTWIDKYTPEIEKFLNNR
jgi:puromycin-sensitive aminopeptidase